MVKLFRKTYEINLEIEEIYVWYWQEIVRIFNEFCNLVHYFLLLFHKCTLHFLRKALEDKKKLDMYAITNIDNNVKGYNYN